MKLFYSYDTISSKAYIIRVKNHQDSEQKSIKCAESCTNVGQPWEYWDAYDGTGDSILTPYHHITGSILDMVKITDHYMTRGEVAAALSHISLWQKCVLQDKPLVILEHDSIMLKPYLKHEIYNSIAYLGGHEQATQNWQVLPTPPHASEGPNYHFICRAHAYAIDPVVAKNMLAYVLQNGINGPLDIMIRADIFPIHQLGLYAYNDWNGDKTNTTIKGRPLEGRSTVRNDDLRI
jgi:GR25 family glycosyltransferase involved in LPS biosynthesis